MIEESVQYVLVASEESPEESLSQKMMLVLVMCEASKCSSGANTGLSSLISSACLHVYIYININSHFAHFV